MATLIRDALITSGEPQIAGRSLVVPEKSLLAQLYTRIGSNWYRFESGTDFVAALEVDDWGIVRSYSALWEATTITGSD